MEYVEGGPLSKQTSTTNPLAWERAARYAADVADGLDEVHAAGLLHRDLKPHNILWDRHRDEALLADFGLAAYVHQACTLSGTAGYLAPELLEGRASPKTDVFALAATLFHLVTGGPPFDAADLLAGCFQARRGLDRPVAALSGVPRAIEDAILSGLEPVPSLRADLSTFRAMLRAAHLQALADRLLNLSRRSRCTVRLHTTVSTANERDLVFRPVLCHSPPNESTRTTGSVPSPAPEAVVRTGDLVRLEITADADGHLTILNLGSSGELRVIFPNPKAQYNRIRSGQPHCLTVKLTPPEGTDRAAIIWTREPSELTPARWAEWIKAGLAVTLPPQESTRGMDFVLHEATEHPSSEWAVDVVAITHRMSCPANSSQAPGMEGPGEGFADTAHHQPLNQSAGEEATITYHPERRQDGAQE
jgi:serine/threonine protein kinase